VGAGLGEQKIAVAEVGEVGEVGDDGDGGGVHVGVTAVVVAVVDEWFVHFVWAGEFVVCVVLAVVLIVVLVRVVFAVVKVV
jgi:hypothetical protein